MTTEQFEKTMTAGHFEEKLHRYAELTRAAMAETIEAEAAQSQIPAAYLYDLIADYTARRGKGLRPALLLATAAACGGSISAALPAAAALELLHTSFLIHDDVEDLSQLRRGQPTLHEIHGIPLAINAGDALANLATQPLQSSAFPRYRSREVTAELRLAVQQTTAGQALELGWRRHAAVDLTTTDYLELVGRKTCWYTTIAPLRIGVLLGRWRARASTLDRLGFLVGCAFQIRDDLLDLQPGGQPGKEPNSDIKEGKRTLMLIHTLSAAAPNDRSWITDYLLKTEDSRSTADRRQMLELLHTYGSLTHAEQTAQLLAEQAQVCFAAAFAEVRPSPELDFLRALLDYLMFRSD